MNHRGRNFNYWICLCLVCCVCDATVSENVTVVEDSSPSPLPDEGANLTAFTNLGLKDKTTLDNNTSICANKTDKLKVQHKVYSMRNNTYKIIAICRKTTIAVNITDIDRERVSFLIVQAHSQNRYLILSNKLKYEPGCYVNSTSPGLKVDVDDSQASKNETPCVFLTNNHNKDITVLFMVRNYTNEEPIPGNYKAPYNLTQPYLTMEPNILTTKVTYRAASYPDSESSPAEGQLKYETYLAYMYEKDLSENKYWNMLIATSTLKGLRENAKCVVEAENNNTAEQLSHWFVSYSGVGAVITVVVSYNNSRGTLYSSTVSYGCDFIEAEEYRCTKLVTPMAKFFCASLFFIGGILLFLGHRWLNFTMFIAGFLFFWCVFFLLFAQVNRSNIIGLEWGTLIGALAGGILWLIGWHKFQRPFHSSLLIIVMTVIFVGMVVTYFLRYAIAPKTTNLAAFVVFPVFFAIVIIAYSIVDIKKVHIFSCALLGSYAFTVPFAFYFGSSLTYIVINVIGVMTVNDYSEAVGYPPFQVCDIILLCFWILLFISGMAYQLYREKSSPPFHPPNLSSWRATKKFFNFVFDKIFVCLPMDPDPGGAGIEDRPTWILRVTYSFKLLRRRVTCSGQDGFESGYESFQRVRTLSQSAESIPEPDNSTFCTIKTRVSEWIEKLRSKSTPDNERLLEVSENEEHEEEEDENQLQDADVSCCTFRQTQVVLDDDYIDNSHT